MIFGATGRIGRSAVRHALATGHLVTAFSGRPVDVPGVESVVGDIRDERAVHRAMVGADAIIAAVGPRANRPEEERTLESGMRNIVAAAIDHNLRRIVTLSGAGVDVPGDRKPVLDRIATLVVRRAARHVVGAKQREYAILAASGLDWTALRPPLVIDGPARGYRLDLRLRPGVRVTREDVGRALVDQLTEPTFIRAAPFVLPPAHTVRG
jgi:uncharacterized protein YbjT (DUF2867 family)